MVKAQLPGVVDEPVLESLAAQPFGFHLSTATVPASEPCVALLCYIAGHP
jgi:hypothetical protein